MKKNIVKEFIIVMLLLIGFTYAAYPFFKNFVQRYYFSGIVQTTALYKTKIEACFLKNHGWKTCNGGKQGIPPNISQPKGALASLLVKEGVIKATPVPAHGVESTDIYILTPLVVNDEVVWKKSGPSIQKRYADE